MHSVPASEQPAQETPLISIVIAVHNGGSALEECLAGVDALDYPNLECILVDDASTDGMAALAAQSRDIQLLRLERQSGPATARNIGAARARGEILFFTDADVVLDPQVLSIASRVLQREAGVAAVFGSYDDTPGHPAYLSQYRNLLHHWVHQTSLAGAFTFWSGCGAVRKQVFDEMAGFSPDFAAPSIEDIELGARIRQAGHRIRLEKAMLCKHLKHWRFGNMVRTDLLRRAIPWMVLILREKEVPLDMNLDAGSRVATVAAALLPVLLGWFALAGQVAAILPTLALLLLATAVGLSPLPLAQNSARGAERFALAALACTLAAGIVLEPLALWPLSLLAIVVLARLAFYRFLYRRRNAAFALAALPLQLVHFMACAVAVPAGFCTHFWHRFTDGRPRATSR